jgi:hypothetical protein
MTRRSNARTELEEQLRLPIGTLCLAVLSRTPGNLEKAKEDLLDAIEILLLKERKRGAQNMRE